MNHLISLSQLCSRLSSLPFMLRFFHTLFSSLHGDPSSKKSNSKNVNFHSVKRGDGSLDQAPFNPYKLDSSILLQTMPCSIATSPKLDEFTPSQVFSQDNSKFQR